MLYHRTSPSHWRFRSILRSNHYLWLFRHRRQQQQQQYRMLLLKNYRIDASPALYGHQPPHRSS